MEVSGAIETFQRSESVHGLRFSKFLEDGDFRAYKAVKEMQLYGDKGTENPECVGYVKKWMGTQLRALKLKMKAIRNNTDKINSMKRAYCVTYFHKVSFDAYPQHDLCPTNENTWKGSVSSGVVTSLDYGSKLRGPSPKALVQPNSVTLIFHQSTTVHRTIGGAKALWFPVKSKRSNGRLVDTPFCCKRCRNIREDTE
ncbi:uncharacterized protein TNCV_2597351 [Trichonephila clavipes]|nr:uncharacterized protein TNCV_2597351 [Trichonephila clavipes]